MRNILSNWYVKWVQFGLTVLIGIAAGLHIAHNLIDKSGFTMPYSSLRSIYPPDAIKNKFLTNYTADSLDNYVDKTLASELARKVRVLCWVMTYPDNHYKQAIHVKATWGKRCNLLLFMSTESDETLPAIKLPVSGEGRDFLWGKTREAFRYVYDHYREHADWFLKADDDTYVIVENLRYLLGDYNSTDPYYFGYRFRPHILNDYDGYNSGRAGYVLSRAALDRFVERALPSPKLCKQGESGSEDIEIAMCLHHVGVSAMDTRDSQQKGRFFILPPDGHLLPNVDNLWYWKNQYYKTNEGLNCCSERAITFHYITPKKMYAYEYLLYHLRPYGVYDRFIVPKALWMEDNNSTEDEELLV